MSAQNLPQAAREYFAAVKAMDAAAFAATFAEDGVLEDPVGTPPNQGHAAIQQFFNGITGAFTAIELAPDNAFVCGSSLAVTWTGRGTAKNGNAVQFSGVDVIDLNADGKIKQVRAFWDAGAMMAQLQ